MPTNAQAFSDYYANSVVSYWDTQRAEARALLIKEGDDNRAYIKSLESAIRAADDDIRGWVTVSDTRERAEMQALVRRNKEAQRESRRRAKNSRSAQKAAASALSKPEDAAAKAATGQAETGSSLGMLFQGLGEEQVNSVDAVVSALSSGTDLVRVLEQYKSGSPNSGASKDVRIALAHGIVRTAESVSHRKRGVGPSDKVIRLAAARMVGLADNEVARIGTYDALLQEEVGRAASTVQAAKSSGAGAAAVAADLEARGWDPFDFLPEMEVDVLSERRADLQKKLEEARAARVPDLDAALESEVLKRTEGVGQGLQFGGGFLGAMQFGAHNKKRMAAAEASLASAQGKMNKLNAMSPADRKMYIATARGMQSFGEYGSNRPTGEDELLWGFGAQVATMHRGGGFDNAQDLVQNARALVDGTEKYKNLSKEEREVLVDQVLEFSSMQQLEGFRPPGQGVMHLETDEAYVGAPIEAIDSNERRKAARNRGKNRGKAQVDIKESGKAAAVKVQTDAINDVSHTRDALALLKSLDGDESPRLKEARRLLAQRERNLSRIQKDPNSSRARISVAQADVDEAKRGIDSVREEAAAASYWDKASTGGGRGQDYDELLRKTRRGISSAHGSRLDPDAKARPPAPPAGRVGGGGADFSAPGRLATAAFEAGLGRDITVEDMAIAINKAIAAGKIPEYRSASTLAKESGTYGGMFSPGGSAYSPSPREKRLRKAERLAKTARGNPSAQRRLEDAEWNEDNSHTGDVFRRTGLGEVDPEAILLEALDR